MMRKIKVIIRKHERLIISLPQSSGASVKCNDPGQLVVVPSRIKIQNRRFHAHHQSQSGLHYHSRALLNRPKDHLLSSAKTPAASQSWERVVEDRAKMIEMHAF